MSNDDQCSEEQKARKRETNERSGNSLRGGQRPTEKEACEEGQEGGDRNEPSDIPKKSLPDTGKSKGNGQGERLPGGRRLVEVCVRAHWRTRRQWRSRAEPRRTVSGLMMLPRWKGQVGTVGRGVVQSLSGHRKGSGFYSE